MNKILFGAGTLVIAAGLAATVAFNAPAPSYEYMTLTTIESIIPAGLGRSRILIDNGGTMQEVKIENFYSAVGINMENIYNNDKTVTAKLNELSQEGWELTFINTGVQSPTDGGKTGIYCTRYILRRAK
jgi:hypothetical protein